jgi:hypothetical protein
MTMSANPALPYSALIGAETLHFQAFITISMLHLNETSIRRRARARIRRLRNRTM